MKVKLLKKVRKRYSITRVDKLVKPCDDLWMERKELYGNSVFYILKDKYRDYKSASSLTIERLKEELVEWVKKEYKGTRETKIKQTKVWYNG